MSTETENDGEMFDPDRPKFGWFSAKQAEMISKLIVYQGVNGEEVVVTQVSKTNDHGALWDDMKFVGMVTHPIRFENNPY